MQKLTEWPPALLRKWLALVLLGIGCLAVGVLMLIISRDVVLLTMSILLSMLIALRCLILFRQIRNQEYTVLEGTCVRTSWIPFQRRRAMCLITEDEEEYTVSIENKMIPRAGEKYRVFILEKAEKYEKLISERKAGVAVVFAVEYLSCSE